MIIKKIFDTNFFGFVCFMLGYFLGTIINIVLNYILK